MRLILALVLVLIAVMIAGGSEEPLKVFMANEILANISAGRPIELDHVIIMGNIGQPVIFKEEHAPRLFNTSFSKRIVSTIKIIDSVIFGSAYFENMIFDGLVDFSGTTFNGPASFKYSTFNDYVKFNNAHFNESADFGYISVFSNNSYFRDNPYISKRCIFNREAHFTYSYFNKSISFGQSQFNSIADFSHSHFEGDAYFLGSQFNSSAYFQESQFNGIADVSAKFNGVADFVDSQFNKDTYFNYAQFNSDAFFQRSQFNTSVFFGPDYRMEIKESLNPRSYYHRPTHIAAKFDKYADFIKSQFNYAYFTGCVFEGDADFRGSRFKNHAEFVESQFNSVADFSGSRFDGPLNFINIKFKNLSIDWISSIRNHDLFISDRLGYLLLIKHFKDIEDFEAADDCYYHYRNWRLFSEDQGWTKSFIDLIFLITCGYGVKPLNTIFLSILSILFFGFIYWRKGIIQRRRKRAIRTRESQSISYKDAVFYSTSIFFTLHPASSWNYSERWRYLIIFEDILGGVLMILFVVAVGHAIVR
jgi:hypothetical protein